jgi:hypothetical protein
MFPAFERQCPIVTSDMIQRTDQQPIQLRVAPSFRIVYRDSQLKIASPSDRGPSSHYPVREGDGTSNNNEVVNDRI